MEWLITLQVQISIAVLVILLLRQAMKKLPKIYSYLLWLLVFARLLVPVSFETRFSFMPSEQEREALAEQVLDFAGLAEGATSGNFGKESGIADTQEKVDNLHTDGQSGSHAIEVPAEGRQENTINENDSKVGGALAEPVTPGSEGVAGSMVSNKEDAKQQSAEEAFSTIVWVWMVLWVVGTAVILGCNGIALRKVRRSLQSARFLLETIPLGKGNAPVYVSDHINTPFSLGFLKPVIYLPAGLNEDEQAYILCHERVHISRKDNMVKHVAFLLTAIYWFNPLVWVAFFLMERDMEMSCDEKVLKLMGGNIKRDYSQSLLNFAAGRSKMPATHLTFGENSVKQRVKNVLSYRNAKKWTVGIGVVVLIIVVVALFTTGREDDIQDDLGNLDDGNQSSEDGTGNATCEVKDPITVYLTIEEALEGHCERFLQENIDVYTYEYDYDEQTGRAVIEYYVREDSVWKEHIILENVKIAEQNAHYYVEQEDLTDYSTVETGTDFDILYLDASGNQDLKLPQYWNGFYRHAIQQLQAGGREAESYTRLMDPVLAAVDALNLGAGSGVVKLEDGTIINGGGPGSAMVDAHFLEHTCAFVTYTFDKDGSTVEFPVYLVEESYGLWSVNKSDVREIFQELNQWQEESFRERFGFTLEFTDMGIYRNADGVLTNIFPHYISPDLEWWEQGGILYFPIDSEYREGNPDYSVNTVCMLDLLTGEFDKETLRLENMPAYGRNVVDLSVHAGYVHLGCGYSISSSKYYVMPLVNTGNTPLATGYTYNGKAVKDLSPEELDTYGVALRDEILKKDEVMMFANRTMTETYAYVDLDGDSKTEKIVLSANKTDAEYQYVTYPYDCFKLQVGDSFVTGRKEGLENGILFFSPDGRNVLIALYGTGPSDDYTIMMYLYKDGELRSLGNVECNISDIHPDASKGVFTVHDSFSDFVQPVWFRRTYKINESGQLEEIPQDTYDMIYGKYELPDLLVPLPVYEAPGGEGEVTYIQPQKVDFIKMDNTYRWVYLEAADGTSGWFGLEVGRTEEGYHDVRIKGLDLKHWEVFTTYYAG